jgi:hypothetical protein
MNPIFLIYDQKKPLPAPRGIPGYEEDTVDAVCNHSTIYNVKTGLEHKATEITDNLSAAFAAKDKGLNVVGPFMPSDLVEVKTAYHPASLGAIGENKINYVSDITYTDKHGTMTPKEKIAALSVKYIHEYGAPYAAEQIAKAATKIIGNQAANLNLTGGTGRQGLTCTM